MVNRIEKDGFVFRRLELPTPFRRGVLLITQNRFAVCNIYRRLSNELSANPSRHVTRMQRFKDVKPNPTVHTKEILV